ncbi:hypothetical protein [Ensifer aridi]|uniref:hypothetical protein n=1 Tax=Ensifer aridi TaxID=1708715 RepID=UPI000408CE57|nr:hypothetical protein [Ensifer aridi]
MVAAEQLTLDVAVSDGRQNGTEVDLADAVLQAYGGDAKAAVRELLLDADFLRDQLHIAATIMSKGMGRGWMPKYERV